LEPDATSEQIGEWLFEPQMCGGTGGDCPNISYRCDQCYTDLLDAVAARAKAEGDEAEWRLWEKACPRCSSRAVGG